MKFVWSAHEEIDQTEGRGGATLIAYCETEELAKALAKGKGVMGGIGPVTKERVFEEDGKLFLKTGSDQPITVLKQADYDAIKHALQPILQRIPNTAATKLFVTAVLDNLK